MPCPQKEGAEHGGAQGASSPLSITRGATESRARGAPEPPSLQNGLRGADPHPRGVTGHSSALPPVLTGPRVPWRTTHPCPFCGRGCREGVCAAGFFHPCVPLSHFLPERVRSCSPAAAGGQMQRGSTGPRGVPMAPRASPGATSPDLGVRAELHLWRRHVLWKCFSRAGQRWSTLISGSPASGRTQRGRLVPFQRGDAGSPEVGRCERSSGFHSLVLAGM